MSSDICDWPMLTLRERLGELKFRLLLLYIVMLFAIGHYNF